MQEVIFFWGIAFSCLLVITIFSLVRVAFIIYALKTGNTKLLDILCGDDDLY